MEVLGSMIISGMLHVFMLSVQMLTLIDLQMIHFIRWDLLPFFYVSLGGFMWVVWICYDLCVYFIYRGNDARTRVHLNHLMLSKTYMFLAVTLFSVLFIRWTLYYGGGKAGHSDTARSSSHQLISTMPDRVISINLIETVFSALAACTTYSFLWTLVHYTPLRDISLSASSKTAEAYALMDN